MTTTAAPPTASPESAAPAHAPITTPRALILPTGASTIAVLLGALALSPLFVDGGWFGAAFAVIVAVMASGAVAVALRSPLFLVPLVQVFVLFCALIARFVPSAPLGMLPSPDAIASLRALLTSGIQAANTYAPPIPTEPGVTAVAALGMGCIAILVFVLYVVMRAPVLAGAALIAIYVVPAFVLDDGAPWWGFVLVAVGWMVLLAGDERVDITAWGRALTRSDDGVNHPVRGATSSALRLGALGVVVALAVPILVPALTDAVLGRHDTGVGGSGGGAIAKGGAVGIDPSVSLRRNLTQNATAVMLTYTGTAPTYLRLVVVDQYSNEIWHASVFDPANAVAVTDGIPGDRDLPDALANAAAARSFDIRDNALTSQFLPVPEHLVALSVDGAGWYLDPTTRTVFGDNTRSDQLAWHAASLVVSPSVEQLRAAPTPSGADLTDRLSRATVPSTLVTLAASITAGKTTTFDKVLAIQNYFRDNFTYSTASATDSSTRAGSYLDSFLADRSGYCQQFAAAMALMVQSIGVPARVVVGFTQGTQQSPTQWVVHGSDAHAWPEVYFTGIGWTRFEPTPGGSNGTVTVPSYAPAVGTQPPSGTGTGTSGTRGGRAKLDHLGTDGLGSVPAATSIPAAETSLDQWRQRGILAVVVLIGLLALVPGLVRTLRRRRRLADQAEVEGLWEELRDTALDLGIPWASSDTPRQAVASVIAHEHLRGDAAVAVTRLGRATERARYAATAPSTVGLADDVGTVRSALLARADRGQRWRARLLPASLRRRGTGD